MLRKILRDNLVVIFPGRDFEPWDHMPRFQVIDCDLREMSKKTGPTRVKI